MSLFSCKRLLSYYSNAKSNTQKSFKISQFLKSLDWYHLEKSLLLRGLNYNISHLRKLVKNIDTESNNFQQLENEIIKLPNNVHKRIWNYGFECKEIGQFTPESKINDTNIEFSEICKNLNIFRMEHLGNYTGHKSYYLFGKLAEVEQALIQYSVDFLEANGFKFFSVPDILPKGIIKACGMETDGNRTQVYEIDSGKYLSGTAEMAIAGFFVNKILKETDLPIKCAAVSRCYRAETSGLNEEKGIYRVHQFSKVEMFTVCSKNQSEEMVETFKELEMDFFKTLKINFRVLDMPPSELGTAAYQKYDIETWMPGRMLWGEISSCSNCTDYQSQRLNIRYITNSGDVLYAHTVNGTAAAIPRLLISLIESKQIDKNTVKLPTVLKNYLRTPEIIKEKNVPEIKLLKKLKNKISN